MATSEHTRRQYISNITGTYTFSQAIEIMKVLDSMPAGPERINWVSVKTRSPVTIGHSDWNEG